MDLSKILPLIAVLACPIGMGLMMWFMNKNMNNQGDHAKRADQTPSNSAARLTALREQRQMLEAEIAETARLSELEAQREALLSSQRPAPDDADVPATQQLAS